MDWVTISGVKPWDGRYELDLQERPLTTREWGWAKRYAGYLPLTLEVGALADPEMIAVIAIVALHRNGKIATSDVPALWERFQDAPFGDTVSWEAGPADDEEEDDADPPPQSSDARPSSNGDSSTTGSDPSEQHPSPTGSPHWATSESDPVTSET